MSTFNSLELFSSGPHRFHVGGLSLRCVVQAGLGPEPRGVRLAPHGVHGRSITQAGDLIADTPAQLAALIEAIENQLDGQAHDLVDDLGRAWTGVVMLSFEPEALRRLGPRWAAKYRIQYLKAS